MKRKKLLPLECAALAAFLLAGFAAYLTPFVRGCRDLYDGMLRLHVIANSDTPLDQQRKLLVRDTILIEGAECFDGAADADNARKKLTPHFTDLEEAAETALRENGCTDEVHISLEKTYCETRQYGEYTVPAGVYTAVCVRIGEAEGHNWWCVMFPPLCLPAATKRTDASFTPDGKAVLGSDPKYDVRFKVVEWVQNAKAKIHK